MPDLKITALAEDTAPSSDDLVVTVNDPAGTPANKKASVANLSKAINLDNVSDGSTNKVYTGTEQTKLTGIETAADVTDTTNVTAAGALMDSELASIADVKALDQSVISGATPTFTNTNFTEAADKNYVTDAEATVIGNTSGSNTGDESDANATTKGIVELATTAETTTGTDATRAVTPDGLKDGYQGSTNITTVGTIAAGIWSGTAIEGSAVASTGEGGGTKFLREDGDNTCSWQTPSGSGDVSKVGTPADSQVGVWTGDGTIEGTANFTYDESNLQLTGDIGSTGTKITKGWFTDLVVTNAIAGGVTGNAGTATAAAAQAITDNAIATVDDADAADNDYAKFTASGLEGRSYAEVVDDIGSSIDTVGTIGTGVWEGTAINATYLDGQSGTNTGDEVAADLTTAGVIEIATGTETNTGTDATRAVSPDGLEDWTGSAQVVTVGTLASGDADAIVTDASTTAKGKIEVAIASEVNTGTSATLAVSPDAFAGSNAGIRYLQLTCFDYTTDTATGDGKGYFHIPAGLDGMDLIEVHAQVITAGTTNTTDIQIHNLTQTADMLSTVITIDTGETGSDTAAAAAVIDTAEDDIAENDLIRIDVDAVSTTAAKGLIVTLGFRTP